MEELKYKQLLIVVLVVFLFISGVYYGLYLSQKKYNEKYFIEETYAKLNYNYTSLDQKSYEKYNVSVYALSVEKFFEFMGDNYEYKRYEKDCKYWAKFYDIYFTQSGYKTKYVLLDNHIFVVAYNNENYIIADGLNIRKVDLNYYLR